jgi:hypothetical protein
MQFEELDSSTRAKMEERFDVEQANGDRFRSAILTAHGLDVFPELMRVAIRNGNEESLADALMSDATYWEPHDADGKTTNVRQASQRLALSEFNTSYVAGLAHKLVGEGHKECEVYRAANPKWEHASCSSHEGQRYELSAIVAGHRITYWPPPGLPDAFSIPAGPGCHHTIRRCQ